MPKATSSERGFTRNGVLRRSERMSVSWFMRNASMLVPPDETGMMDRTICSVAATAPPYRNQRSEHPRAGANDPL